jgi:anti-sigma regulatory factor (Ser/Thr protein kinase)
MHASGLAHTHLLPPTPTEARHELYSILEEWAWPGDTDGVVLAVHEAIMNSERHAGGATRALARTDGDVVEVEIHDEGPGFDVAGHTLGPPDPLAERGRGLWLISQIADRWQLDRDGGENCFRLLFRA